MRPRLESQQKNMTIYQNLGLKSSDNAAKKTATATDVYGNYTKGELSKTASSKQMETV